MSETWKIVARDISDYVNFPFEDNLAEPKITAEKMVEMIAERLGGVDKSKVRLWDQDKRAAIKSKTGLIKKLFPDGNVWFVRGTVAKSLIEQDVINGDKNVIIKTKDPWKDYTVKQVEELMFKQLGLATNNKSKIHIQFPGKTDKISEIYKTSDSTVFYMRGILAQEYDGSQVYYFPDDDTLETNVAELKTKIAKKVEVDAKYITILDKKKQDTTKEKTKDIHSKGVVMFKLSKIIARENLGGRVLHFPGKNMDEMKVKEMKNLITQKLNIPRDKIQLCDPKNKPLKNEDSLKKVFGEVGEVIYKLKLTTNIPSDILKLVTIDRDEDDSIPQIDRSTIQDNIFTFKDEKKLFVIEDQLVELEQYFKGRKGRSKKITQEQYDQGKKTLDDQKKTIEHRQRDIKKGNKHMVKMLAYGEETNPVKRDFNEFEKKRNYIIEQNKLKKRAVESNFPFSQTQEYYIHNYKRTTPKWVINLLFQYHIIEKVPDVVRAFNDQQQFYIEEETKDDDAKKIDEEIWSGDNIETMSHYVTDDFDIMPMPEHSISKYVLTEEEENEIMIYNDSAVNNVKKPMPNYTNFKIKLTGKEGEKSEKLCIKIKNPSKMTIREFKSYLLTKTLVHENNPNKKRYKPFIFRFDIENDKKVSELIELQKHFDDKNKPVRKKSKKDPKIYEKATEPETYFDVYTDFKNFSISLDYDASLTQIQRSEIEEEWYKIDKKKTGELSAEFDGKIEKGTDTDLGLFYYKLTEKQVTVPEIKSMDVKAGKVTLENFIKFYENQKDEKLPTVQLKLAGGKFTNPEKKLLDYQSNLLNERMAKALEFAEDIVEQIIMKKEGKPENLPSVFRFPESKIDDSKILDQILIITENGKSFPLLKCYDKNISLKDLGVTRYSKLKYKVVRMETKDLKDAMLGKNQRNFFEQENIIKETDDEGAVMKEMRKDMAKKLKRMNPNIMWMASESEIKCEIPEYLRAPFIEQKEGVKINESTLQFDIKDFDMEYGTTDQLIDRILDIIHSKPRPEEAQIRWKIDKAKEDEKDEDKLRRRDLDRREKEKKTNPNQEGATTDCYLDLFNFENRYIGDDDIRLVVKYKDAYDPYEKSGQNDHADKDKYRIKKNQWKMERGWPINFYQQRFYVTQLIPVDEAKDANGDNADNVEAAASDDKAGNDDASDDSNAADYGSDDDEEEVEAQKSAENKVEPPASDDDSDDSNKAEYDEEEEDEEAQISAKKDEAKKKKVDKPKPKTEQIEQLENEMFIEVQLFNIIALQIDDTNVKNEFQGDKIAKNKKWKFIKYNTNIRQVGDLAKYLKTSDIMVDEKREELCQQLENDDLTDEAQEILIKQIEDTEIRDEVMRQNLFFLFSKTLVPKNLDPMIKRDKNTQDLIISVGLRQNLHRQPDYILKVEESYLLNEMRAIIYNIEDNVKMSKIIENEDESKQQTALLQEIRDVIEKDESFKQNHKGGIGYPEQKEEIEKLIDEIIQAEGTEKDKEKVEENEKNALEKLIRMYTKNLMFRAIDQICLDGQYQNLSVYLRNVFKLNEKHGLKMTYEKYDVPIYRGINFDQYKVLDYEPDSIRQWCCFTKCDTSIKAAYGASYKPYELVQVIPTKDELNKQGIIKESIQDLIIQDASKLPNRNQDLVVFKIFCKKSKDQKDLATTEKDLATKVLLQNDKEEDQVVLLPFFTFRVAYIEETREDWKVELKNHNNEEIKNKGKITFITLVEVPYQKNTEEKPYSTTQIDSLILTDSNEKQSTFASEIVRQPSYFPDVVEKVQQLQDYQQFSKLLQQCIKSTVRTVIVVQCQFGMSFVRQLYNGLNTPTNIKRIFIFSQIENPKVKEDGGDRLINRQTISTEEINDLIQHIKSNTRNLPWKGESIQKKKSDGSENLDGQKFKAEDSFVVDAREVLKDEVVNSEEKKLINQAFLLLIDVCDKTRISDHELQARLEEEKDTDREKRLNERKAQVAKDVETVGFAAKSLRKERLNRIKEEKDKKAGLIRDEKLDAEFKEKVVARRKKEAEEKEILAKYEKEQKEKADKEAKAAKQKENNG